MPKPTRFDSHHAGGGFVSQPSIRNCHKKEKYKTKALANKVKKKIKKRK